MAALRPLRPRISGRFHGSVQEVDLLETRRSARHDSSQRNEFHFRYHGAHVDFTGGEP